MEYVIVVYPARREVFIDGESQGFNKWENGVDCVLRLGVGQHRFTLGGPLDFTPDVQDVVVERGPTRSILCAWCSLPGGRTDGRR